jgi:hypothetical protein
VLCPFCLANVTFRQEQGTGRSTSFHLCPDCKEQVPALYMKNYRRYPPVVVSAIGFRGHGKTVYFATFFYALKKLSLAHHWPGFFPMCLNEESLDTVYDNVSMLEGGALPDSTPKNFPRPTMIQVAGIPMQRNCTLLCYDTGGESFERATQLVQFAGFVRRARTAMLLVSVPDLDVRVPENMHRLLNTYVVGLGELGASTKNQHLVVVYTKADDMAAYFTPHWDDLYSYLITSSMDGLVQLDGYMGQLHKVSAQLHEFTYWALQAHEFINLAKAHFRSVTFSIISALGTGSQGRLPVEIVPWRVLDPLLWMMEKSLPGWRQTLRKRWS